MAKGKKIVTDRVSNKMNRFLFRSIKNRFCKCSQGINNLRPKNVKSRSGIIRLKWEAR
jgi:hypothetical protein